LGPSLPPVIVWIAVQLLCIGLSCAQVQWAANFVRPAESAAVEQLLLVQLACATMLAPWLLRNWVLVISIAAASWPFIQLACFLSALPAQRSVLLSSHVAAWLIAMRMLLMAAGRNPRMWMVLSAAAGALVLGGAVVAYLGAESWSAAAQAQRQANDAGHDAAILNPLLSAFSLARDGVTSVWQWATVAGVGVLSGLVLLLRMLLRRFIHRSSTHLAAWFVDN
jgi:hypothetical protein